MMMAEYRQKCFRNNAMNKQTNEGVIQSANVERWCYNYESNQQDATLQVNLLFLVSSTCFGRCFRPSPGALDCIYSFFFLNMWLAMHHSITLLLPT